MWRYIIVEYGARGYERRREEWEQPYQHVEIKAWKHLYSKYPTYKEDYKKIFENEQGKILLESLYPIIKLEMENAFPLLKGTLPEDS